MKKLLFTLLIFSASISKAGTIICEHPNQGLTHIFIDSGDYQKVTEPYKHYEADASVTYVFGRRTEEIQTTILMSQHSTRLGEETTYTVDLQEFGSLEIRKFLHDDDRTAQGILYKKDASLILTCFFEN
jgi:hypothetical protein